MIRFFQVSVLARKLGERLRPTKINSVSAISAIPNIFPINFRGYPPNMLSTTTERNNKAAVEKLAGKIAKRIKPTGVHSFQKLSLNSIFVSFLFEK